MPKNELIFDNFVYFSSQCDNQPLGYDNWSFKHITNHHTVSKRSSLQILCV
jgi:hypothetical protein